MRRIVAAVAQILLGGWYGAGKNRRADAYGRVEGDVAEASSAPGRAPSRRRPVGADQQATMRIMLPGAGLPVRTRKSDQPRGRRDRRRRRRRGWGCRRRAVAGASTTWQRFVAVVELAEVDVDAARERADVDRLQRPVRHRTAADGVRGELGCRHGARRELALAHRSEPEVGREHLAVGDLRRAHRCGRRRGQRAHRRLGQVGLGDRAVLDLLAGDRCPCEWSRRRSARLAWAGPPSATNRAMRATTIAGEGRRRVKRMRRDSGRSDG